MMRSSRILPKLRNLFSRKAHYGPRVQTPLVMSRNFYNRGRDPFTQMEAFMKDMERKFWNEFNSAKFPFCNRLGLQGEYGALKPLSNYSSSFFGPSDLSTADKFKLRLDLPHSKPEDIKVTLKDRLLTIEGKSEESSETSKFSQSFSYQYDLPETVNIESLQSTLGNDGIFTVEANKTPDDTPKTINIQRE